MMTERRDASALSVHQGLRHRKGLCIVKPMTTCTTPLNQGRAERGQMVFQKSGHTSLTALLTDLAALAAHQGLNFHGAAQAAQARVEYEAGR